MLNKFAHFLLKRNRNAAIVAFLCGILPVFLGAISVIILALITLRKGARDGFFVLSWGVLPVLARGFVDHNYILLTTSSLTFVLVWIMAVMLFHKATWSTLFELCIILSVFSVCLALFFQPDIDQWWVEHITSYMQMMVQEGFIQADDKLTSSQVEVLAQLSTGVEALLLLLFAGVKLAIARWWDMTTVKAQGFRQEFLQVRLAPWLLLLFMVLGLAAWISAKVIFMTLLIPVAGFLAIAGLCLLHAWMQGYKYAGLALFGFYIVLIVVPYVLALPLLIGLVDSGLNLRVKLIRKEV